MTRSDRSAVRGQRAYSPTESANAVAGAESAYDARLEAFEATRPCSSCGVDDFTQVPLKKQPNPGPT
jgi:hypothetical protein